MSFEQSTNKKIVLLSVSGHFVEAEFQIQQ